MFCSVPRGLMPQARGGRGGEALNTHDNAEPVALKPARQGKMFSIPVNHISLLHERKIRTPAPRVNILVTT